MAMAKVMLIDGGPRKGWNTDLLLAEAERGAREAGAETEVVRLFDLDVKDCQACMACKRRGNKTNGICAINDDLKPILERAMEADGIIVCSPIYFGSLTGQAHSFTCRLLFPAMHYENDGFDPVKKKKRCGLIMSMNVPEAALEQFGYAQRFGGLADIMGKVLGSCSTLFCCDTLQFTDYSEYYAGMFDEKKKRAHREEQFPIDLQRAYEMGRQAAT